MKLSFLHDVYCPKKGKEVYPEELYLEMKKYQLKNDRTAKVNIPADYEVGKAGTFTSRIFSDPMEGLPFDIEVDSLKKAPSIQLDAQYSRPKNAWDGPGIVGRFTLNTCGVSRTSGNFKIRPLWKKITASGVELELFEGSFSLDITYSSLYKRKGHGSGINCPEVPFWGIRSYD